MTSFPLGSHLRRTGEHPSPFLRQRLETQEVKFGLIVGKHLLALYWWMFHPEHAFREKRSHRSMRYTLNVSNP